MSVAKAISGNNVKNNGSSLLHAGNVTRNEIGSLDYGDANMLYVRQPQVSGLVQKAISGGDFNKENSHIAMGYTTTVGGNTLTALVGGAGMEKTRGINGFNGYNRYDITSVDILSGDIVYGSANGLRVSASGLDGTTGVGADIAANPTYAVPAKLVYREDSGVETKNYSAWTG